MKTEGKGFAKDLTPFIEKEGTGFLDVWYPLPKELMKHKGKIRAMPGDYMTMVLFYNTEMFKAAGLDPNSPPQDLGRVLRIRKKTNPRH